MTQDYDATCIEHGGGLDNLETWHELRRLLGPRHDHGWRFEVINQDSAPEAAWLFGLGGEARFVAMASGAWITVYVSECDETTPFTSRADFSSWLSEHEIEYSGFTDLYRELRKHLETSGGADREMFNAHDAQLLRQSLVLQADE